MRCVLRALRWGANGFVFLVLRISLIDCSFSEVANGDYVHRGDAWPLLANTKNLNDDKSKLVEAYLDALEVDAKTRYDRLDSKLRTLLATNALVFGLVGGFSLALAALYT